MSEAQQYGTRWEDLPADEQLEGYWMAVRDRSRYGFGGRDYEVVFVEKDVSGDIIWPCGLECESVRHWRFLRRLDLPASAAEVMSQVEREKRRNAVWTGVDAAGREIAEPLFPLPKTLRREPRARMCPDCSNDLSHTFCGLCKGLRYVYDPSSAPVSRSAEVRT